MTILRVPPNKLLDMLPKPFLSWLRDIARAISFGGLVGQDHYSLTTTDATPTIVWALDVPAKSVVLITVHSIAIRSTATAVRSQRESVFAYRYSTGNVIVAIQVDADSKSDHFYIGTLAASVAASGTATQVQLKATGIAGQTWKWQGYVEHTVLAA